MVPTSEYLLPVAFEMPLQFCRVGKRYPVCDHLKDMILEEVSQHGKHPASALADNGFLTDKTPAIGYTSPQPDYKLFYEAYKNNIARIEIERTAKNALNSGQISLRHYSCIASMLSKNSPVSEIEKLFTSCVNGDI